MGLLISERLPEDPRSSAISVFIGSLPVQIRRGVHRSRKHVKVGPGLPREIHRVRKEAVEPVAGQQQRPGEICRWWMDDI